MDDFLYNELNKAWKTTCKVLFKEEIGELKEYEEWLEEFNYPLYEKISFVSNKKIIFSRDKYNPKKFISYDEVNFNKKFEPLNINEIKDIDSIVEALKERFVYAGNIILGKSEYVEDSTNVVDSFYVYNSSFITSSEYIYSSQNQALGKYLFGSLFGGQNSYLVRCFRGGRNTRAFELYQSEDTSDAYYSYKVDGCNEVMFSFNQWGKTYLIGNLQLEREKYYEIKSSLIQQLREELKKEKKAPSIYDFITVEVDQELIEELKKKVSYKEKPENKEIIEKAFTSTSSIVLKKPLHNLDDYREYLEKNNSYTVYSANSVVSGKNIYLSTVENLIPKEKEFVSKRAITEEEALAFSQIASLSKEVVESKKLEKIKKELGRIALAFPSIIRRSSNCIETEVEIDSYDTYRVTIAVESRFCAFSYWPRNSQYSFGTSNAIASNFVINVYDSKNITRAFEVDSSRSSSDIYFCHNVENVINGMFSFNIKNRNYVIGNAVYDQSTFNKIKEILLEQITDELESKKTLKYSIFSLI